MRPPRPLPQRLRSGPFTREEAAALGVGRQRLTDRDVIAVGFGVYETVPSAGWPDEFAEPGHGLRPAQLAALARRFLGAVYSHATAAHLFRLPVPESVLADSQLHLTWYSGGPRSRIRGITAHRSPVSSRDRGRASRLPVTRAPRTWVDLAGSSALDVRTMVAVGDRIVNRPWHHGIRFEGLATIADLAAALERAGSVKGSVKARAALPRIRVGADSPPETRARLALIDAGLPEPLLQVRADPADPDSPTADMAYLELRLAIQYDGAHHRSRRQQSLDAARDEWFQRHGWRTVRLNADDLSNGFIRLIGIVRARLAGQR